MKTKARVSYQPNIKRKDHPFLVLISEDCEYWLTYSWHETRRQAQLAAQEINETDDWQPTLRDNDIEERTKYHLVTVTVTYHIEQAKTADEAIDIAKRTIYPPSHLDGVILEDYRDGFCSTVNKKEQGIECTEIVKWP